MASLNPVTGYFEIDAIGASPIGASGYSLDLSMWGNVVLPGAAVVAGATVITSSSAAALVVGRLGATTPVLKINAATATVVTGIEIIGAASGDKVAMRAISSAGNEGMTINAKGSGQVLIGGISTGNVVLGQAGQSLVVSGATGAVTIDAGGLTVTSGALVITSGNVTFTAGNLLLSAGTATVTSANALALAVGRLGATTPAFSVDASAAVQVIGIKVTGGAAGAGAALAVVGATNEALSVDAQGSGVLKIGATSTGLVILGRGAVKGPILSLTITDIDAQNAAPTIAQMLGGYIRHTSAVGGGTMTTPTGANISGGITGVAVGDSFETYYVNDGNQTVTLTAGDANVTFEPASPATVATLKNAMLRFVNTGPNTWKCFVASALG